MLICVNEQLKPILLWLQCGFSKRELTFTFAIIMVSLSPVRLSVCRL